MKVALALTADYANTTPDAKLNIGGLFLRLPWQGESTVIPMMYAVFVIDIEPQDYGTHRRFGTVIKSPSGEQVTPLVEGAVTIPKVPEGDSLQMNQVVSMTQMRFPEPGVYSVTLLVDGEEFHRHTLHVVQPNR